MGSLCAIAMCCYRLYVFLSTTFSPQYWLHASIPSCQKVMLHVQRCEMELKVEKIEQPGLLLSSKPEDTELQPVPSGCVVYRGVQPSTAVLGMASFSYWGPFFFLAIYYEKNMQLLVGWFISKPQHMTSCFSVSCFF